MAELTQRERLQPSLLDRLKDDEPHQQQESREKRVLSARALRKAVVRDLEWLLNTGQLSSVQDLEAYPLVAKSVLNYGTPDLAGQNLSGLDVATLERTLRDTICNYEPRLLRNTVKVRLSVNSEQMNLNAVTFEIEGKLWAQPMPTPLYIKTEIDLELGEVKVTGEGF